MIPARVSLPQCLSYLLAPLLAMSLVGASSAQTPPLVGKPAHTDRHGDALPSGIVARIGTVRFRHSGIISALSYSPDGKILAGIGREGARLWDATTGKELQRFYRHDASTRDAFPPAGYVRGFFSPDGRRLWLQTDGVRQNAPNREIHSWLLSPIPEPQPQKSPFTGKNLHLLAASPDGKFLVLCENNVTRICAIATGKDSRRLPIAASAARYSADGKVLTTFERETIVLRNAQTGAPIRSIPKVNRPQPGVRAFTDYALAPDGNTVAVLSGGRGKSIRLADAATGKELWNLQVSDPTFGGLRFSPDGKILVGDSQHSLRAWDAASGQRLWERHDNSDLFYCKTFSLDGKTLVVGRTWDVRRYDTATGRERPPVPDDERIDFARLLADGRTAVTAASGKPLRLWRLPIAEEILPDPGRKRPTVPRVADVSSDGRWMVSRSHADGDTRIWDIAAGTEIRRLPHLGSIETPARIAPGGQWVQTLDIVRKPRSQDIEYIVRFWDRRTGKLVSERKGDQYPMTTYSPDGRLCAMRGSHPDRLELRTVPEGALLRTIAVPRAHTTVSFSADGRLLVDANMRDGPPRLWEVASGKEIATLADTTANNSKLQWLGAATQAAFSPNDRRLLVGDYYGNLYCWNTEGRFVHRWKGDHFPVFALRFTPDGKKLLSGGFMTALFWSLEDVLPFEKRRTENLTAEDLNTLWSDLRVEDTPRAYRAVWRLADSPGQAVPFLRRHLRPAQGPDKIDAARIARLIGDLDDDVFAVREKASRDLAMLGRDAEPALRQALAHDPATESKRRIEELLRKMPDSPPVPPPDQLRDLRALAVLEHTATDAAREVLKELSHGHGEARLTREAKESLTRLLHHAEKP